MSTEEPLCWYCQRRPAQPRFEHDVPLKRDESERDYILVVFTSAQTTWVPVPRCARCWAANIVYTFYRKGWLVGGVLLGVALLVFVVTVINDEDLYTFWSDGLTFSVCLAAFVAVVLGPARVFIALHPRNAPQEYPPIAHLLAEGWTIGNLRETPWDHR